MIVGREIQNEWEQYNDDEQHKKNERPSGNEN